MKNMSCEVKSIGSRDFEMDYIKFGSGAKNLVILPGLSIVSVIPAAPAIEKQYEIFEKDYTVYLFDRRKSLPADYSVYDMAEDTVRAINELKLSEIYLFGTSQGGMMAMYIAARYPDLVKALAAGSAPYRVSEEQSKIFENWIALAENEKREELYLSFGEKVYPDNVFEKYKDFFRQISKGVTKEDLKRFVILAKGVFGFDLSDVADKIICPFYATGDTEDLIFGETASELERVMKHNSKFEKFVYQGYGHASYDAAPDYANRLFEFFNKY